MNEEPGNGSKFVAGVIAALLVAIMFLLGVGVIIRVAEWAF
jgi:hypothetical protein